MRAVKHEIRISKSETSPKSEGFKSKTNRPQKASMHPATLTILRRIRTPRFVAACHVKAAFGKLLQ